MQKIEKLKNKWYVLRRLDLHAMLGRFISIGTTKIIFKDLRIYSLAHRIMVFPCIKDLNFYCYTKFLSLI